MGRIQTITEKQIFDIIYPECRYRHRNKLEGNKKCIYRNK